MTLVYLHRQEYDVVVLERDERDKDIFVLTLLGRVEDGIAEIKITDDERRRLIAALEVVAHG